MGKTQTVKQKRKLYNWYTHFSRKDKKAKNGNGDQDYKEAEAKVNNLIRKAKRGLEKRLAQDKHRNSKPFYNYVKKKTSSKAAIRPLLKDTGEMVSDEVGMAEELNSFFSGVFTRENVEDIPVPPAMKIKTKLRRSWITTHSQSQEKD